MITLLYFAWVREKIGLGEETLSVPAHVKNVGDLIAFLIARGDGYADALGDSDRLRIAVNQDHVDFNYPVSDGDEIAIFPPVTGG